MDDGGSPLYGIAVILIIIVMDALFYGFGAAVQALNENQVETKAKENDQKSLKLLKIMENPGEIINTIQILTTTISIFCGFFAVRNYGTLAAVRMAETFPAHGGWFPVLVFLAAFLFFMYLLLTFGVFVPKTLAAKQPEHWAYRLVGLVTAVCAVCRPYIWLIKASGILVLKLFGVEYAQSEDDVTEEEIISMVNEGHEQGVLLESEAKMINNIFEFGDKEAKDIMTHRKNINSLNGDMLLEEAMAYMMDSSNSRYPVYDGNIDNIIGIIHLREALRALGDKRLNDRAIKDIPDLIKPALFIPETQNINVLFKDMQSRKIHMIIVIDEYGQTAGLVAMEDILEEIVGNILDEYDEEENFIQELGEGCFLIDGITPLEDIEEYLDIRFEEEDIDTLNGFLINALDHIPVQNESFVMEYQGYRFELVDVRDNVIRSVRVSPIVIIE